MPSVMKNSTMSNTQVVEVKQHRREALDHNGRPLKKPRASRPKVKSGCVTCKTRRVKCDERKPSCIRCEKFGRICDGYASEPVKPVRSLIQLQPRISFGNIHGPSVSFHNSEAESQYFNIFVDRVAYELPGFFEPTFWSRLVLQESHLVPAIRHAAIALGALNKSLEMAPAPQLKVNVIQSVDRKHHEQAVFHHIKAIQALNVYISAANSPQLRTALMACLLFICFETFQGSFASSVQQTYGGLKILRNYYVGKPGSRSWIPRKRALLPKKPVDRKKVTQALLDREGCDHVFKEVAIAMHVEEYFDSESEAQTRINNAALQNLQMLQPKDDSSQSAMYDPLAKHVNIPSMGGTDLNQEHHRTLSMYKPNQQEEASAGDQKGCSTLAAISESPWQANYRSRKNSIGSTPESTGPHTLASSQSGTPTASQSANPTNTATTSSNTTSRKRPLASSNPTPPQGTSPLKNELTIEEVLIQSFVRLDGQGLFFGMTPGIPPLLWDIHKIFEVPIPTKFHSFAEAQRCWDFLMDRALQFYRRTTFHRAYAPMAADTPAAIAEQHTMHVDAINAFSLAFEPLLEAAISPTGEIKNPAALVLSLYPKTVIITLCTITVESEMLHDNYLADFAYIVRTCARLISAEDTIQLPRNKRFSFDVSIIPPLHVAATKCRDPMIRREAVELLFKSPRQEGMWDSVLSARIGRWIIACEEDGLAVPLQRRSGSEMNAVKQQDSSSLPSGDPSLPHMKDENHHQGGWEDGKRIRDTVIVATGHATGLSNVVAPKAPWRPVVRLLSEVQEEEKNASGWLVPESSRVQLMVVDFHIPERYIIVKCQKVMLEEDGTRQERETVIAW